MESSNVPAEEMMFDEHVTDALLQRLAEVSLQWQLPVLGQTKSKLRQDSETKRMPLNPNKHGPQNSNQVCQKYDLTKQIIDAKLLRKTKQNKTARKEKDDKTVKQPMQYNMLLELKTDCWNVTPGKQTGNILARCENFKLKILNQRIHNLTHFVHHCHYSNINLYILMSRKRNKKVRIKIALPL